MSSIDKPGQANNTRTADIAFDSIAFGFSLGQTIALGADVAAAATPPGQLFAAAAFIVAAFSTTANTVNLLADSVQKDSDRNTTHDITQLVQIPGLLVGIGLTLAGQTRDNALLGAKFANIAYSAKGLVLDVVRQTRFSKMCRASTTFQKQRGIHLSCMRFGARLTTNGMSSAIRSIAS
jgi:hypothetical protein